MKTTPLWTLRRHGYKARAAAISRVLRLSEAEVREPVPPRARLKTVLTFESRTQAYLWTTDRGRSQRLIKH